MSPTKTQNPQTNPLVKLAVSYQRVSTEAQGEEDRSGFSRQGEALTRWKRDHPDYEVRVIKEAISGRKNVKEGLLGRFLEDAQKGSVAPGTVLVVETFSRLSRDDMQGCMQLMLDIFKAGLGVSFCDFGNQILRSLDETGGTVHQIVGAASNSHREWLEKRDRTRGARRWRREQIAENASGGKSAVFGNYRFKPRSECPIDPGYPRWLDVDADGNWVQLEKEVAWVQRAFRLAKEKGAVTISQALRDIGVTQARSDTPIKVGDVDVLLRNIAVMGWRQHFEDNVAIGDPVKGVYPAIITPAEFDAVQVALKSRNYKRVPNGRHRHNLFEAQTFCDCCGAKLGLRNGRNGHAFYCSSKKNKTCDAPNIRYDEEAMLNRLHHFRWADFFGSDKHEAELANARRVVLTLTGELGALQDKVEEKRLQIMDAEPGTPVNVLNLWDKRLEKVEAAVRSKEQELTRAEDTMQSLERRPTGRKAEREVRRRLKAFMDGDRTDLSHRNEFNGWLVRENLGFAINTRTGRMEFGRLKTENYKLVEIDCVMDDAAAMGLDLDKVAAMIPS